MWKYISSSFDCEHCCLCLHVYTYVCMFILYMFRFLNICMFTFLYVGIFVSSLSLARPVCFVCVGVYVLFTCGHTNKLHSASACGLLTMDINTLGTLVKKKSSDWNKQFSEAACRPDRWLWIKELRLFLFYLRLGLINPLFVPQWGL